ncbi:MAG: hypothetical protein GEU80_12005 [Dehalococcoidia bacterium]|nr:hypothetical protein [Dehalococcoidia bacterium]
MVCTAGRSAGVDDGGHRAREGKRTGPGALNGLTVLELGDTISAPYAAKLLADLGADVIKVEPPSGDTARQGGGSAWAC